MEGQIILAPGHSDESVCLIMDEGMAFTGDLPGRAWGAEPIHQVEMSWQRKRALNVETICPRHGLELERKLEKLSSETAAAHPRSRAAGHLRRRRMKTEPGQAETNLS